MVSGVDPDFDHSITANIGYGERADIVRALYAGADMEPDIDQIPEFVVAPELVDEDESDAGEQLLYIYSS